MGPWNSRQNPPTTCPNPPSQWKSPTPPSPRKPLHGLVESFVLREGTDYGEREFSHAQKVAQVIDQLESGEARILYDPETQSVTLLPK